MGEDGKDGRVEEEWEKIGRLEEWDGGRWEGWKGGRGVGEDRKVGRVEGFLLSEPGFSGFQDYQNKNVSTTENQAPAVRKVYRNANIQ